MLKNYFITSWRSIIKNRTFSIINITGLSIGMTCCIIITLFVLFEINYDKHNRNADRIYRAVVDLEANTWAISAFTLGANLQENFPEVEKYTRIKPIEPILINESTNTRIKQKIFYADSTVFEVLDIQLLEGNPATALAKANTMVLTEERAQAFFGNEDPIGKFLTISGREDAFEVTGIFEPLPSNSHVHMDVMASSLSFAPMRPVTEGNGPGYLTNHYTYFLMNEPIDHQAFGTKVSTFLDEQQELTADDTPNIIKFQPLTSIHLTSNRGLEIEANGNMNTIYIFSAIAFFILLIACINFINLSTAQSLKRAKEVGIRKAVGSNKSQLVFQFLSESVIISLVSLAISIVLLVLIIPKFNELSGKQLVINPLENIQAVLVFLIITIASGFVAGIYPAFFISSFQPVKVLKGTYLGKSAGQILRKGLVVFQFAIAFVIIVGTYVVNSQLNFMLGKNIGFDREQVLVLTMPNDSIGDQTVKNELLSISGVQSITRFNEMPGRMVNTGGLWYEGADTDQAENLYLFSGDADLLETLDITLLTGKYFNEDTQQHFREFVINEKAVEHFGWKMDDAVGKQMNFGNRSDTSGIVIGVVKDFHFKHLHEQIDPLVMYLAPNYEGRFMALKINSGNISETVSEVNNKWNSLLPSYEFDYQFLDSSFDMLFDEEKRLGELFALFAGLAISISCLGLFGLTVFTLQQKKKAIAVRKVLGASVTTIVSLVSRDFLKPVVLGMVLAAPIAYYSMSTWLEGFAYNVGFQWIVFLYALVAGLAVAFITISFHCFKAAVTNPVNSLRQE
ncbi:MAG: ABC transporter permease [Fulvivirga sp.]|uniref:ABC transporter permease n=1 Tax=Fulvivirga sp. TaxID=1931237 RepID=UPI0032EA9B28